MGPTGTPPARRCAIVGDRRLAGLLAPRGMGACRRFRRCRVPRRKDSWTPASAGRLRRRFDGGARRTIASWLPRRRASLIDLPSAVTSRHGDHRGHPVPVGGTSHPRWPAVRLQPPRDRERDRFSAQTPSGQRTAVAYARRGSTPAGHQRRPSAARCAGRHRRRKPARALVPRRRSRSGLPRPELQVSWRAGTRTVARVDAFFPGDLVVELAGHGTHSCRAQLQRDEQRRTELTLRGFRVITFTYNDVRDRPSWVIARLRDALGLWAA
ncbi:MAG: Protein of unknown function (DUF559)/Domain of unknown function [Acidimicrobiales bacterium]|nr:Protein of unknown function (DUF559)/Domain of unknown function [Acidimicrobiales bacterium]